MSSNAQQFETQIEKMKATASAAKLHQEKQTALVDRLTKGDVQIGVVDFDIEKAELMDVIKQQKAMQGNIADLILTLDDKTNAFGSQFDSMKSYSGSEKLIKWLSPKKAQSMRTDRVRNTNLDGNLQELLSQSNQVIVLLKETLTDQTERKEAADLNLTQVITLRQDTLKEIETVKERIEALLPDLQAIESQIAESTSALERGELEGQRSKMASEYNECIANEQKLLSDAQAFEVHIKNFQVSSESLTNQIAGQKTLISKLEIDTERRVALYKDFEVSLKAATQQELGHTINTLGTKVDAKAVETMAAIGAASQSAVATMLEAHKGNMHNAEEIIRKKKLADDAFYRRFENVKSDHDAASY